MGLMLTPGGRAFDTRTGRFLSRDPVGDPGHRSYAGLSNNPVGVVDPSGMTNVLAVGHQKFWQRWSQQQRKRWFDSFKSDYGARIRAAGLKHCVPAELLAAVIANEQIDYSLGEKLLEKYIYTEREARHEGRALSVGVAQIRVSVAEEHGAIDKALFKKLTGYDYPPTLEQYWDRYGYGPNPDLKQIVREYLSSVPGSIDTTGALLAAFMRDLCEKVRASSRPARGGRIHRVVDHTKGLSRSFMAEVYGAQMFLASEFAEICCNTGTNPDCQRVARMDVSANLISAMSAYWNGNPAISSNPDLKKRAWPAYIMSHYAKALDNVFRGLWPRVKQ